MTNIKERNCFVLVQLRKSSDYNDFIGKYYHFPKMYYKRLSKNNVEFVYFESVKKGEGVYFGYGKIGKIVEDKKEPDHFFAEVIDYKQLSKPVPFHYEDGKIRESEDTYNRQSSVREITPGLLDEICLDGHIQLNFTADAHLIKVLGEQLITTEKVGILELIKNAYDAQADTCRIRIEKIEDLDKIDKSNYEFNEYEGPVIVVEDDGIGMTKEVIENGWLRPASPLKTNIKEKLKTEKEKAEKRGSLGAFNSLLSQMKKAHGGKLPLGEKGVGRFATHRLGKRLIIKTKTKDLDYEYLLKIDWDKFDNTSEVITDLDSIGISLTRQKPSRDYGKKNSGTQIIIYCGREGYKWDGDKIKDINNSIQRLNSPNPRPGVIKNTFNAYLECPQIEGLVKEPIYERHKAPFALDAIVNEDGIIDEYTLKFSPPKKVPMSSREITEKNYDLKKAEKDHWKTKNGSTRKPKCGAFYLHIDAWIRKKPWIDGPDADAMLKYLYTYGGISIYRDNIIISPAESGSKNDWLNLSKRHIKQAYRLSYYMILGNVEIEQINNFGLVGKTSREDLVANESYIDLGKLIEAAIDNLLEKLLRAKREEHRNLTDKNVIRDPAKLGEITGQSSKILKNILDSDYSVTDDPLSILEHIKPADQRKGKLVNMERSMRNLKKSIKVMDEVRDLLTEQAGFGLAVAVSVHEIAKITSNFYSGVSRLLKSRNIDREKLEKIRQSSLAIKSELKRLSPLRAIRNEAPTEFNIKDSIDFILSVNGKELEKLSIKKPNVEGKGFMVYARYGALNQIFSNLIDNSCYWLDTEDKSSDTKRTITIKMEPEYRTVIFADNGPGVDEVIRPYLFEPGYSLKIPASGLGLYICKHYMEDTNGEIYETKSKERIKDMRGAQFTPDFEKVKTSKEE